MARRPKKRTPACPHPPSKSVLIVVRNPKSARAIQKAVRRLDFEVSAVAESELDAVFHLTENAPDVALVALHLGEPCGGIQCAGVIRERFGVPVVYVVPRADDDSIAESRRERPHSFVTEPLRLGALSAALEVSIYRQQYDEQLAAHRRIVDAMIENGTEGVVMANVYGHLVQANSAAFRLAGLASGDAALSNAYDSTGVFESDEITPFPACDLPLVRAIEGEATDDINLFVRNAAVPQGRHLSVSGRPITNPFGQGAGGMITFHDVTRLHRALNLANGTSRRDAVTGVHDRRALEVHLDNLAQTATGPLAVVLIQPNDFEEFIVAYGSPAADKALRTIAQALDKSLRNSDFVARFEDDVLCAVLHDIAEEHIAGVVESMQRTIVRAQYPRVTARVAAIATEAGGHDGDALIARAQDAMRKAKTYARNQIVTSVPVAFS